MANHSDLNDETLDYHSGLNEELTNFSNNTHVTVVNHDDTTCRRSTRDRHPPAYLQIYETTLPKIHSSNDIIIHKKANVVSSMSTQYPISDFLSISQILISINTS